jgi:hypothetical protein
MAISPGVFTSANTITCSAGAASVHTTPRSGARTMSMTTACAHISPFENASTPNVPLPCVCQELFAERLQSSLAASAGTPPSAMSETATAAMFERLCLIKIPSATKLSLAQYRRPV